MTGPLLQRLRSPEDRKTCPFEIARRDLGAQYEHREPYRIFRFIWRSEEGFWRRWNGTYYERIDEVRNRANGGGEGQEAQRS